MPIVQMPDGVLVDMPPLEALTPEQRKQLEAKLGIQLPTSTNATKTFAKRAGLEVLPGAGGLAGAELAMGAVAPYAATMAATGLGVLPAALLEGGAGVVGAVGGSYLARRAQEEALKAAPAVQESLGVDPETLKKEEEAHGTAATLGDIAGMAVSMRPSVTTLRQVFGKGAAQDVAKARLSTGVGAGIGGGLSLAQQKIADPNADIDWKNFAESTAMGALFNKPTKLVGEPVASASRALGERLTGRAKTRNAVPPPPPPNGTPPPPPPNGTPPPPPPNGAPPPPPPDGTPPPPPPDDPVAAIIAGGKLSRVPDEVPDVEPPSQDKDSALDFAYKSSVEEPSASAVETTPPAVETTPPAVETTPPAVKPLAPAVEPSAPVVETTSKAERPLSPTITEYYKRAIELENKEDATPEELDVAKRLFARSIAGFKRSADSIAPSTHPAPQKQAARVARALDNGNYVVVESFNKFRGRPAESALHVYSTYEEALEAAGRMERKTAERPDFISIARPEGRYTPTYGPFESKLGVSTKKLRTKKSSAVQEAVWDTDIGKINVARSQFPENFFNLSDTAKAEAFEIVRDPALDSEWVAKNYDHAELTAALETQAQLEQLGVSNPEETLRYFAKTIADLKKAKTDVTTFSDTLPTLDKAAFEIVLKNAPKSEWIEGNLAGKKADPQLQTWSNALKNLKKLGLKDPDIEWIVNQRSTPEEVSWGDELGSTGYENRTDFDENTPVSRAETPAPKSTKARLEVEPASVPELVQLFRQGDIPFRGLVNKLTTSYELKTESKLFDDLQRLDPTSTLLSPTATAKNVDALLSKYYDYPTVLKAEGEPGQKTHTTESILPQLKATFGVHTKRLFDNEFLTVVPNRDALPAHLRETTSPTTRAVYDVQGNKVYFIAENIPQDYNLKGLMLHETGVHAGMETMLGTPLFERVLKEVATRAKNGEAPFKAAQDQVPYTTTGSHVDEERLAYLISNYKTLPFVKRILANVRQWLYRKMGGKFLTLTSDDLNMMALASLKRVSDLSETGRLGELRRDEVLAARRQKYEADNEQRITEGNQALTGKQPEYFENQALNEQDQLDAEARERKKVSGDTLVSRINKWVKGNKGHTYDAFIELFQNSSRKLLQSDVKLRAIGKLSPEEPGLFNLLHSRKSIAENATTAPIQKQAVDAISNYMTGTGKNEYTTLAEFGRWMKALTEPDLRKWLYVRNVPMKIAEVMDSYGKLVSPAKMRETLVKAYETAKKDLTAADARQKYGYNAEDIRQYLDYLAENFAEPNGFVPETAPPNIQAYKPDRNIVDPMHPAYDLAGLPSETIGRWRDEFDAALAGPHGPLIQEVLNSVKELSAETIRLNKLNGTWGPHVDNAIAVMQRKNYYPLKGDAEQYNYENIAGTRLRGDLSRVQAELTGRTTESDNPLTQTFADSYAALHRLDTKDYLDEVHRYAKERLLRDYNRNPVLKILDPIKVGERKQYELPEGVSPESIILRPNPEGGYDVIQILNRDWYIPLKGVFTEQNMAMKALGSMTSFVARNATRWNPKFAIPNAIRDLSSNMSTIGAEQGYATGLAVGARFLSQAAQGSAFKAALFAHYLATNNLKAIKRLAAKSNFVQSMWEWTLKGGSTQYNSALSNEAATRQLVRELEPNGTLKFSKKAAVHLADVFNNTFEYMNREAAYSTLANKFSKEAGPGKDATQRAALETKNLMNPELSGVYGKSLASWFAFFRASATGASRQVDSIILPLFKSTDDWIRQSYGTPYEIKTKRDVKGILRDPAQLKKATEYWDQRRKNAFLMAITSLGFGYATREMTKALSGNDENGDNKVARDNYALWNRSLRIPTTILGPYEKSLGEDVDFINVPWGYGAGTFASMGAQLSAMTSGDIKATEGLQHMVGAAKESFLPIPTEDWSLFNRNPVGATLTSGAPTGLKPLMYFAFNADTFGRQIYGTRFGRYSEAYSGGDYVPEDFKDLAKSLYETSNGEVDIAPQSLQFFANNYISGIATLTQMVTGSARTLTGEKNFDVKQDTGVLGSFLGSASDPNARAFTDTEAAIQKLKTRMTTFANTQNSVQLDKFLRDNPSAPKLVEAYDDIKYRLNKYNAALNDVRAQRNLSIDDRKKAVDELRKARSMYMKQLNEFYEANK